MDWKNHIVSEPSVYYGKPVITGTRIPVDLILEKLADGDLFEDVLSAYPSIKKEDIYACLSFASEAIKNQIIIPKAS